MAEYLEKHTFLCDTVCFQTSTFLCHRPYNAEISGQRVLPNVADYRHLYHVLLSERGAAVIVARLHAYLVESAQCKVVTLSMDKAAAPASSDEVSPIQSSS